MVEYLAGNRVRGTNAERLGAGFSTTYVSSTVTNTGSYSGAWGGNMSPVPNLTSAVDGDDSTFTIGGVHGGGSNSWIGQQNYDLSSSASRTVKFKVGAYNNTSNYTGNALQNIILTFSTSPDNSTWTNHNQVTHNSTTETVYTYEGTHTFRYIKVEINQTCSPYNGSHCELSSYIKLYTVGAIDSSITAVDGSIFYETDNNKSYVLYNNTWSEL
tara:strand:- start:37 stop:678 length:642 start_codon:yes stop_codon:yes gene_type:complete